MRTKDKERGFMDLQLGSCLKEDLLFEDIDCSSISDAEVSDFITALHSMARIRIIENRLAEGRKDGQIGGPVHLGVGQEAVAVGISGALTNDDYVFGAHRSHSHILALGSSPRKLIAEVRGKATGLSCGMGGSMHLSDLSVGFVGSVPIVAGTIPLAVGAAMAAKMQKGDAIAVVYLGDGACEEGVFHESLNLASAQNLPVLFVVENNFYASHMHITERQPSISNARFAKANSIRCEVVDGNNFRQVSEVARDFVQAMRKDKCPALIEAFTYRWYGHVDWRDDVDVGISRSSDEIDAWKACDPIARLLKGLVKEKKYSVEQYASYYRDYELEIRDIWNKVSMDSDPKPESLLDSVYEKKSTD